MPRIAEIALAVVLGATLALVALLRRPGAETGTLI